MIHFASLGRSATGLQKENIYTWVSMHFSWDPDFGTGTSSAFTLYASHYLCMPAIPHMPARLPHGDAITTFGLLLQRRSCLYHYLALAAFYLLREELRCLLRPSVPATNLPTYLLPVY